VVTSVRWRPRKHAIQLATRTHSPAAFRVTRAWPVVMTTAAGAQPPPWPRAGPERARRRPGTAGPARAGWPGGQIGVTRTSRNVRRRSGSRISPMPGRCRASQAPSGLPRSVGLAGVWALPATGVRARQGEPASRRRAIASSRWDQLQPRPMTPSNKGHLWLPGCGAFGQHRQERGTPPAPERPRRARQLSPR
jgi:hypothetical protein